MRRPTTRTAVIIGAALLLPAAAPAAPPGTGLSLVGTGAPAAAGPTLPVLRQGARGAAVRDLQQRLKVAVDGVFGPVTHGSVLAFQTAHGLVADGIVGPQTWRALGGGTPTPVSTSVGSTRPTLRIGAAGPPVAEAQRLLTGAGHRASADGLFGPATQAATVGFQRARGLAPDGVIGRATWSALTSTGAPTSLLLVSTTQPAAWRTFGARSHAVRPGDTLASVAAATGSTASALALVNRLAPGAQLPTGATLLVPGAWRCPVPGGGFINDFHFARAGHLHQGNDIFAMRGTPVLAPVGGRVVAGDGGLGGRSVNLYGADGNRYYLAHLDRWAATGSVSAGTVIGYVGNTGNAVTTLPHLHFEIHPGGGAAVNPYPTLVLACRR